MDHQEDFLFLLLCCLNTVPLLLLRVMRSKVLKINMMKYHAISFVRAR